MKNIVAIALGVLVVNVTANAGEIVRLKTGFIKTNSATSMQFFAANNNDSHETGLYIAQFKSAITEAQKMSLAVKGLQLISYIPDDAFLVRADQSSARDAATLGFIQAMIPYHAGMKIEPELTQNGVFAFGDQVDVVIQTSALADETTFLADNADLRKIGKDLFVARTLKSNLWKLAARADVIWIERFMAMQSMDMDLMDETMKAKTAAEPTPPPPAYTGFESGTKVINADTAYAAGIHGEGQFLSFADTGLDTGDIKTLTPDFQGQVKSAYAMGLGGSSWGDSMGHGTHVAGSIAGNGKSSDGRIKGTAFGAKLVAEGMWSDIMNNLSIPGIPKLFQKAYDDGARIHSNSWGAPNSNGRYDSFAMQVDTFMWNNQDFLAVFAAGNDGQDGNKDGTIDEGSVSSPGSAKNCLTVGASKNYFLGGGIQKMMKELRNGDQKWGVEPIASSRLSEDAKGMAAFSSRGPTADGRIKPEVVAPGTNIVSVRSSHPKMDPKQSWGIYDDHYIYMGGTSMATPVTTGAMGLVRQYLMKTLNASTVSAALLKATVANTAFDLFPGQFGVRSKGQEQPIQRPNNHEGWGRVDLANLVGEKAAKFIDDRTGLATGKSNTVEVKVANPSKGLHITMAYTDAPGATNAAKTLVNDLDLTVTDSSGKVFYPNHMSGKDNTNTMEQIDIESPTAATYKVTVTGASVPTGKNGAQPYALVVSGGI